MAYVAPELIETALDVNFGDQLEQTFGQGRIGRGRVVRGVITHMDSEMVTIDVGMKAEGKVPVKEFIDFGKDSTNIKTGDMVDVFVENLDNRHGEAQLSREKAKREEVLDALEEAGKKNTSVKGIIFGKVKGGFMVDVQGILGFMPGSQLDARPITDANPFMHTELDLMIVKLDRKKNNLIVSRRAVQDQSNTGSRDEVLADMKEGKVLKGVVKNITDYGAFVDLGGIDGLLHITDIAWHRIGHPSEVLKVGSTIDVMVVRYDQESHRVSLGMKQLQDDPWKTVDQTFAIGSKVNGTITNVTDYGAFVGLAPGVEGLIHVSEMSWTRKNLHPSKVVSVGQKVEVKVLEIDREKRRISLGLKQTQDNPWQAYAKGFKVGDVVEGTIRSITDFGVFVGLNEEIDGLIHISDLSWSQSSEEALQDYRKGEKVKAQILALDAEKERIALGVKQLTADPFAGVMGGYNKGQTVKVTVASIGADGITVKLDGVDVFIRARDLGVSREEQDPTRYKVGAEIEAKLTTVSAKDRKVNLSIRALMQDEEKAAVAAYGEQEEGGDSALAAALKGAGIKAEAAAKPEKKAKAEATAETEGEEKPKKKTAKKKDAE
ncbi:MAG: 30S ribosomal protein S1 [Alphaproteobacteria bacterium]